MAARLVSRESAEHYTWRGGEVDCDAWFLVKTPELHVIEEQMPPGARETPHHHVRARQFFFVIEGELTMLLWPASAAAEEIVVCAGEGLEIAPGEVHQAINRSAAPVRFVVTSQPPSHGDRVNRS